MTSVSEVTDTGAAAIPDVAEAKNTEADVVDRAADVVDRAGNAIVELVNRAANNGQANLLAAQETAEKLAYQLRAAQGRIMNSRRMSDTIKIGQNAPRNGCIRFHRRFSKGFSAGTILIVRAEWQSDYNKPRAIRLRHRRFCGV